MFDYLLITITIVFIVDLSGFADTLLDVVSNYKGRRVDSFKPFTCSLCLTWWVLLAYSLFTGITIGKIALSGMLAYMTIPISQILILAKEFSLAIINKLYTWIEKISR